MSKADWVSDFDNAGNVDFYVAEYDCRGGGVMEDPHFKTVSCISMMTTFC